MGIRRTVVFTDLHGSTGVFETLGNARATEVITRTTAWIGTQCELVGGRLIKTLGDGVLVLFENSNSALQAVIGLQRGYSQQLLQFPPEFSMPLRIGVACGEVEMVDGDCYGDAVNVASRLCDLCGPNQVWFSSSNAVQDIASGITYKALGPLNVRGRSEPCIVYQIEWHEEAGTDFLTMQADLASTNVSTIPDPLGREVALTWLETQKRFKAFELPIQIGRVRTADFMVNDPRVSRIHARLEWRNGSVVFVDTSSYGSWIRFAGASGPDVLLRREECVLHGKGELALGASFSDASVPSICFEVR